MALKFYMWLNLDGTVPWYSLGIGVLSPGREVAGCKIYHSAPSSAKVKNE